MDTHLLINVFVVSFLGAGIGNNIAFYLRERRAKRKKAKKLAQQETSPPFTPGFSTTNKPVKNKRDTDQFPYPAHPRLRAKIKANFRSVAAFCREVGGEDFPQSTLNKKLNGEVNLDDSEKRKVNKLIKMRVEYNKVNNSAITAQQDLVTENENGNATNSNS